MQVGTRISGGPYNYGVGIVTKYEPGSDGCYVIGRGMQAISGYVDIVWPTHESLHLPVNIVASLPYRIHTDRLGTAEEIAEFRAQAAIYQAEAAAKKDEAAKARFVERERLLAKFPHLIRCGETCDHLNAAAKNIRAMLKAAFPGVKFTVRTERYSGGDSINVGWTDGPKSSEVKAITSRFEAGSFDGMTDRYDYNHSVFCDLFGDAKYVFENRRHTPQALREAVVKVMEQFNDGDTRTPDEIAQAFDNGNLYGADEWKRREINQALGYI